MPQWTFMEQMLIRQNAALKDCLRELITYEDQMPCASCSLIANCEDIERPPWFPRRLPRECERLQGFPDDYTLIPYRGKPARDGPRYKALGNSMAVPVIRWIGERIMAVENLNNHFNSVA